MREQLTRSGIGRIAASLVLACGLRDAREAALLLEDVRLGGASLVTAGLENIAGNREGGGGGLGGAQLDIGDGANTHEAGSDQEDDSAELGNLHQARGGRRSRASKRNAGLVILLEQRGIRDVWTGHGLPVQRFHREEKAEPKACCSAASALFLE